MSKKAKNDIALAVAQTWIKSNNQTCENIEA